MNPVRHRALHVAGLSLGGVVLGHCLAYLLVHPVAHDRHAALQATGHGSFGLLALTAVVAVPLTLAFVGARAWFGQGTPGTGRTALRLAAIQVPAFAAVEIVERGSSPAAAFGDPVVAVGLALQVVLAVAAAVLVSLFVRAVRRAAAGRAIPETDPPVHPRPITHDDAAPAWRLGRGRRRAPPVLLPA
jgi:hypothetical protein